MADGEAGGHARDSIVRSHVRQGSYGRAPYVFPSLRGHRVIQR